MIQTLQEIMQHTVARLSSQAITYLPPLLVALAVLAVAWMVAWLLRWSIQRLFKGVRVDRFLAETGLSSILGRAGHMRSGFLVARVVYWAILIVGLLAAINVFDTKLTTQVVETTVFLFPKLLTAGIILLAGFWLAQYLGQSVLLWACNEDLPTPRRWASAVRAGVMFVAVVVAADALDFARTVFLSAFIICAGGTALALSLAFGLGGRDAARRYLRGESDEQAEERKREERSLWSHL